MADGEKKMKVGLLFPGQGSQSIGMGRDLYEDLPAAKTLLDRACDILGYDIKSLMFDGDIEELTDTRYAQPAIFICSAIYLEKAKEEGIAYDYVAGHSLGEYSAIYAAGVFDFETGLKLVDTRAKAMSAENGKGSMAAVLGLTEAELGEYLKTYPDVVMANLNSPTQIVVSGDTDQINDLQEVLAAKDINSKKLAVSAAFHSPHMNKAKMVMKDALEAVAFNQPKCYVVSNVSGKASKEVDVIQANLIDQITGQVRWYDSINTMVDAGVEQFYECGNGKVLRKMNKTITLKVKCGSI